MAEPQFWRRAAPLSISDIAAFTGAKPRDGDDLTLMIANVAPLDDAGPGDLAFLDNPKYAPLLESCRASAVLVAARHAERVPGTVAALIANVAPLDDAGPGDLAFLDNPKYAPLLESCRASAVLVAARHAERVPGTVAALIAAEPYRAYAQVAAKLYPQAARPLPRYVDNGVSPAAHVHPSAQLENGVTVDPGAVIGARAQIGAGAVISANAVIGPDVCIGRDSVIGSGAQIGFALIGDRVIIHPGVCIGQDGFGFAMGPRGHLKVPQLGRVIIQNDVEIGANSTIDRGANRDTVIGEGTKIDNFVQIGHNVTIGRHCILVSHVGIAGSAELGDFVAIGGQAGVAGHLKIGMGAQIAAQSGVASDVPPGERWGGSPARPMRHMARQIAMIDRMVNKGS